MTLLPSKPRSLIMLVCLGKLEISRGPQGDEKADYWDIGYTG